MRTSTRTTKPPVQAPTPKLQWDVMGTLHFTTYGGKLGRWVMFKTYHDGGVSREETKKHRLTCSLPGIKTDLGLYETTEKAREYAEKVLIYWLKMAGLQLK